MPGPAGDEYDYKIVQLPGRDATPALITALDAAGVDGWQVVAIDTLHARIILKRQTV